MRNACVIFAILLFAFGCKSNEKGTEETANGSKVVKPFLAAKALTEEEVIKLTCGVSTTSAGRNLATE